MTEHKSPPSEMIRVPVVLIPVVRQLSSLHREGHTIALLQALKELLDKFDINNDSDLIGNKLIKSFDQKLEQLESRLADRDKSQESKLEAITKKLEQLEQALTSSRYNNSRPRKSYPYPYQQPQVELQPRTNESLATRLAVTPQSLTTERERLSTKEFISWSRNRDPMTVGWEWNASEELYHPIR